MRISQISSTRYDRRANESKGIAVMIIRSQGVVAVSAKRENHARSQALYQRAKARQRQDLSDV